MKSIVWRLLLTAIILSFNSNALADEAFVGYGIGVFGSASNFIGETKVASVGYRHDFWKGIYWKLETGYWGDGSGNPERKSSPYLSTGPGMAVNIEPVEIRSGIGLATIGVPDAYLGKAFPQFNEDFYVGLRDQSNSGIGIKYSHISCASFCSPNQGRDFMSLELSKRW